MSSPHYLMYFYYFHLGRLPSKWTKFFGLIFHPSVNKSIFIQVIHQTKLKLNHTKPNSSIPNRTQLHQTKFIHTKPNSSTPSQTHPYQTKRIHTKPNSSKPNRTQPHQTKLIHTKPNSTTPNQTQPHQIKLIKPNQARQFPTKFDQPKLAEYA